jgi:hypothetical protein
LLALGIELLQIQIHSGDSTMSTAVILEAEDLANEPTILKNQSFILKNQEEIKKNQETLTVIVKNQEKILAAVRH